MYPYLLRNLTIDRPNQVWCADITYIPMAKGFAYLIAVMDWFSRRILAWRVSITLEADFCVEALRDAMHRFGQPEIFNTDQGVQFTSAPAGYPGCRLISRDIRIRDCLLHELARALQSIGKLRLRCQDSGEPLIVDAARPPGPEEICTR